MSICRMRLAGRTAAGVLLRHTRSAGAPSAASMPLLPVAVTAPGTGAKTASTSALLSASRRRMAPLTCCAYQSVSSS